MKHFTLFLSIIVIPCLVSAQVDTSTVVGDIAEDLLQSFYKKNPEKYMSLLPTKGERTQREYHLAEMELTQGWIDTYIKPKLRQSIYIRHELKTYLTIYSSLAAPAYINTSRLKTTSLKIDRKPKSYPGQVTGQNFIVNVIAEDTLTSTVCEGYLSLELFEDLALNKVAQGGFRVTKIGRLINHQQVVKKEPQAFEPEIGEKKEEYEGFEIIEVDASQDEYDEDGIFTGKMNGKSLQITETKKEGKSLIHYELNNGQKIKLDLVSQPDYNRFYVGEEKETGDYWVFKKYGYNLFGLILGDDLVCSPLFQLRD